MPPGGHINPSLLSHAAETTIHVIDHLIDCMRKQRLRITDIFNMMDVAKAGRISDAVLLTQRLYEFKIVQSLEEVKRFISDLDTLSDTTSASSAFVASSSSKARTGPGHTPSFSFDEFQKVVTCRRRYRLESSADSSSVRFSSPRNISQGKTPNAKMRISTMKPAEISSVGQRTGRSPTSKQRGSTSDALTKVDKNKTSRSSMRMLKRYKADQKILQEKIEEKRIAVNEKNAADLAVKLRNEELRRQKLTRELAVIQLGEIEANLQKNAVQQILASVSASDEYYDHLEKTIINRFNDEKLAVKASLDEEIAQIQDIGRHPTSRRSPGGGSSNDAPGQLRNASITERRCASVLQQLRDAKLKLADQARDIEISRTRIDRDKALNNRNYQKIRCVLACLREVMNRVPRLQ